MMPLVIVETPFAARPDYVNRWPIGLHWLAKIIDRWQNRRYLRACLRDCLLRGEAPFASHAIYTLPGVLRDDLPDERKLGMEAGFAWARDAKYVVVYKDRGLTPGMQKGLDLHYLSSKPVLWRRLYAER